jgi:hypothetical protein
VRCLVTGARSAVHCQLVPDKPRPKSPTNTAIAHAIGGWHAPLALRSAELLPNAARLGLGRNPILEAGFVDPAKTGAFVKSLRESDALRRAAIPNVLGTSLATQVGRPLATEAALTAATQVGKPLWAAQIGTEQGALASLAGIGKNLAVIQEALMRPASAVQALVEKLNASFAMNWQPQFERFGQAMQQLAEEGRRLDEQTDLFVRRHGWPVPISLPTAAYKAVVSRHAIGKRDVNRIMVENFRPGKRVYSIAREMIDESPDFKSRRPLLRQVYAAQRRGEWYLVINGLLPLVEGVLIDAMFPTGEQPKWKRIEKGVNALVDSQDETYGEAAFRALETIIIGASTGSALFEHYAPPVGVEPRSLNRHGVLHGSARRYGTEQNATKLFLLIVVLAECLAIHRTLAKPKSEQPALPAGSS